MEQFSRWSLRAMEPILGMLGQKTGAGHDLSDIAPRYDPPCRQVTMQGSASRVPPREGPHFPKNLGREIPTDLL